MSDPFLAEIRIVGCNFAPVGYAMAQGQVMPISQNTALFSLLGTNYGGNGQTTYALPNFTDRAPISQGQGSGLPSYSVGQTGGSETIAMTAVGMASAPALPIQAMTFLNSYAVHTPYLALNFIIALQGIFPARP